MNYSKDVLSRARAILAQRKADRESENAAKLQSAYARVPRLKEIDMALVSTMAQAAQAAFLQGSDGKAALERARQSNLQLQEERNALVERYWEPGYLNEEPVCPHCGGTGYVGAQMCQCLKALCAQEQRKEMGAAFQNAGFDSFLLDYYSDTVIPQLKLSPRSVMEKTLGSCRRYARNFSMDAGNLLLSGGTGLGKTASRRRRRHNKAEVRKEAPAAQPQPEEPAAVEPEVVASEKPRQNHHRRRHHRKPKNQGNANE